MLFDRINRIKSKSIKDRLKDLEIQVNGEENKSGLSESSIHGIWYDSYYIERATLKSKVDDLQIILKKQEKLTHMILEHLKLEYVKITEENGSKTEKEILRPITKKKLGEKNKENNNCDCCDYVH